LKPVFKAFGIEARIGSIVGWKPTGAAAVGSLAVGATAIGALAIGRLAIRRAAIQHLRIEELEVGRLRVESLEVLDERRPASQAASDSFAIWTFACRLTVPPPCGTRSGFVAVSSSSMNSGGT